MKAIILLQEFRKIKVGNDFVGYQELKEEVQNQIDEAIAELEALIEKDKSCNGCKHLEERELGLRNSCVFEICRSCCRNNNDNWELNNEC